MSKKDIDDLRYELMEEVLAIRAWILLCLLLIVGLFIFTAVHIDNKEVHKSLVSKHELFGFKTDDKGFYADLSIDVEVPRSAKNVVFSCDSNKVYFETFENIGVTYAGFNNSFGEVTLEDVQGIKCRVDYEVFE